jgi:hypothetical protein
LFILLLLFSLAVIDEDQKHIADDASVHFIPASMGIIVSDRDIAFWHITHMRFAAFDARFRETGWIGRK